MIGSRDFTTPFRPGFGYARQAQEHGLALDRVNDWIQEDQVNVIGAETIQGYGIRVWYKVVGRSPGSTLPKPSAGDAPRLGDPEGDPEGVDRI